MNTSQEEPKIADKNILVIKASLPRSVTRKTFQSYNHYDFVYTRFKKYTTEIYKHNSFIHDYFDIERGFHSYMDISSVQSHLEPAYFIIPKGAKYYEGKDNSINDIDDYDARVSNQLIYIGKFNWFTRLIAKLIYKA